MSTEISGNFERDIGNCSKLERMRLAKEALASLRAFMLDPRTAGVPVTARVVFARPRRSMSVMVWKSIGLTHSSSSRVSSSWTHTLLPGWEYSDQEMATEMIEDLDLMAKTGAQPTEATR